MHLNHYKIEEIMDELYPIIYDQLEQMDIVKPGDTLTLEVWGKTIKVSIDNEDILETYIKKEN